MGLPLYVAPVESDLRDRSEPKSPGAHLRSAIRRSHRNGSDRDRNGRHGAEARAGRRVIRVAERLSARESRAEALLAASAPSSTLLQSHAGDQSGSSRERLAPDFIVRRSGALDEQALTVMGERWANLHTAANPAPNRDDSFPRSAAFSPIHPPRNSQGASLSTQGMSRVRIPDIVDGTRGMARAPRNMRSRTREVARRSASAGTSGTAAERTHASPTPPHDFPSRLFSSADEPAGLDGLGDRTRSLSPEDDGVGGWHTLLTTITPDPQPPSIGSSFVSTSSGSATNSQSTAPTGSFSTVMTRRDTGAEESTFEPNCESGCENSDEGEEEDDDDDRVLNSLERFPTNLRARRSWAEIAGHSTSNNSSSGEDPLEFLGDMQRIVRLFARREDIPDEWWAEAGLSRTLSREAPN